MTLTLTLETLAERVERLERTIEQLAMSSEDVLSLNQQAFEKSKADLQARFSGEYVAFVDGKLVGHGFKRNDLLDRLYTEFPGKKVFYRKLSVTELVYRLPSPHAT